MHFNTIEFGVEAGVATLVFNRPDKLNSFTTEMHREVRQAIKTTRDDSSIRCLLQQLFRLRLITARLMQLC